MIFMATQYTGFGHILRRQDSLEKTIIPRQVEGSRNRGRQIWDELIP